MHPSHSRLLSYFATDHLQPHLATVVIPFANLARALVAADGADGPETTVALRKLVEAKDAAVRAQL